MSEEKIQQLNMLEGSLSQVLSQKQQYQKQIIEIESAMSELEDKDEAYQIVGTLMVKKEASKIREELEERMNLYQGRLNAIEKQEKTIKEQADLLRESLVNNLENQ